jgi:DNA-binding transcriptional LysR family regulator
VIRERRWLTGKLTSLAGERLIDKHRGIIERINMNPHQLELFYHVAKSKGVTRAARQMPYGIQQPSVSSQVNALERDLGVSLYQRRPFKLTPAGETLFRFVEPFFGRMTEVRESLQGAAQIRVGASPIVIKDHLPAVIEAVRKQFPRLSMIVRAVNQPELIDAIEHDELDVVISLIPDHLSPALGSIDLLRLPLVLLVPKNSRIKSARDLWAGQKILEPLISLRPNELICQRFQQELARLGVSWLPRIEMDSLDLIEEYVGAGFGVGLSLRVPMTKLAASVRMLELPGFPSVTLGAIYRAEPNSERGIRGAFLAEIRRQAEGHLQRWNRPLQG